MSLIDLVDNSLTDKNTLHSYLNLYQELLVNKKETAKNVLEVGIHLGGSIKLWRDFFTNARVYGIDIFHENNIPDNIKMDSITLYTSTDAYNEDFVKSTFLDTNIKFDFLLDDGPHTLESMISFVQLYSQLLTDDGILIIEDVQYIDWIEKITDVTPDDLKKYIKVYDFRMKRSRYDDIVFIIDKS